MSETERETHPQDPAEGPDEDQRAGDDRTAHPEQPAEGGDSGEHQNEPRELNDGDDVVQPGGQEPPD